MPAPSPRVHCVPLAVAGASGTSVTSTSCAIAATERPMLTAARVIGIARIEHLASCYFSTSCNIGSTRTHRNAALKHRGRSVASDASQSQPLGSPTPGQWVLPILSILDLMHKRRWYLTDMSSAHTVLPIVLACL